MKDSLNVAIIEEDANSRSTIRSHMLQIPNLQISSFSSMALFKEECFKTDFHLIISAYEFSGGKNGAQWCQELSLNHLLKPSVGICLISADTSSLAISQIIDANPDVVLIRPYTMKSFLGNINDYLTFRNLLLPYLAALDEDNIQAVLVGLRKLQLSHPEHKTNLARLEAKLLLRIQSYSQAASIYQTILEKSPQTLWARWGLIKSQFMAGDWESCKGILHTLLKANVTRDKAYEWLACVAYAEHEYDSAQNHLSHIKIADLSFQATKLKSHLLCLQNRIEDAIHLLDQKRKSNNMLTDEFNELTYEMAHCYLMQIEKNTVVDKDFNIEQAKSLINSAGKYQKDPVSKQKRDCLMSAAFLIEGNIIQVEKLLGQEWMQNFDRANIPTLQAAMNANKAIGQEQKAIELLRLSEQKISNIDSPIENVISIDIVQQQETKLVDKQARAAQANKRGTELYIANKFEQAMFYFHKALVLYPTTSAFAINLATCLYQCKQDNYKELKYAELLEKLQTMQLHPEHQKRLTGLLQKAHSTTTSQGTTKKAS